MAGFDVAGFTFDDNSCWTATVLVTGRERTERKILPRSMWYVRPTQPAPLVRGSSRRITIVRFRPADLGLITSHLPSLPVTSSVALWRGGISPRQNQNRGQREGLTESPRIRTAAPSSSRAKHDRSGPSAPCASRRTATMLLPARSRRTPAGCGFHDVRASAGCTCGFRLRARTE
jgi:hypothetical protein